MTHAPLRAYVMGERGADPTESPTADELVAMAAVVRAGVEAGALGFTTSRTYAHRTRDGAAARHPVLQCRRADRPRRRMAETGRGVVQMISDAYLTTDDDFAVEEMALMRSLVEHTGRPLSMTVQQVGQVPDRWREMAAWVAQPSPPGCP